MSEINEKDLDQASGGRLNSLDIVKGVFAKLPQNVQDELAKAADDNTTCKILAQNGINLAEVENSLKKVIPDFGKKILALNDGDLANINGGFANEFSEVDVHCSCGASDRSDFSYQWFASKFRLNEADLYRCKKCNKKIFVSGGRYHVVDDAVLNEW